jgi:hypothetical protein
MSYQDSHLAYVPSKIGTGELSRYDVYPLEPGLQLGWVARITRTTWRAWTPDNDARTGSARWEVAVALWPDPDRPKSKKKNLK